MAWQVLAQLASMLGDTVTKSVPTDEYGVYENDFSAGVGMGGLTNTNFENISTGIGLIEKGNWVEGLGSILVPGSPAQFHGSSVLNDYNKTEADKLRNKKDVTNTMWGDLSQAGRMSGIGAGYNRQLTKSGQRPYDLRSTINLGGVVDAGINLSSSFGGGNNSNEFDATQIGTGTPQTNSLWAKKGIYIAKNKVGSLHKHLGVKEGDKIPASKLKIKDSDSEAIRKKKQFAINAKKFNHKKGEEGLYIDGDKDNLSFVPEEGKEQEYIDTMKKLDTDRLYKEQQYKDSSRYLLDQVGSRKYPQSGVTEYSPIDPVLMATGVGAAYRGGASLLGAVADEVTMGGKSIVKGGLKKLNKSFKSEIDWSKWNKEISNNTSLLNEYHYIEQVSKSKGTWMKNVDGTLFNGTPEQFVQQQSSNFKKAFPNGIESTYRGSRNFEDNFNTGSSVRNRKGEVIFTTDNKIVAGEYGNLNNPVNNMYHPDINRVGYNDDGGLYELIYNKNIGKLTTDAKGKSWRLLENKEIRDYIQKNHPDRIEDLDYSIKYYHNEIPNDKYVSTDLLAQYIKEKKLPMFESKNTIDSFVGSKQPPSTIKGFNPSIINLKSRWYNNGMFNMDNPNIFKSIPPLSIGIGINQLNNKPELRQGGYIQNGLPDTRNTLSNGIYYPEGDRLSNVAYDTNRGIYPMKYKIDEDNMMNKIKGDVIADYFNKLNGVKTGSRGRGLDNDIEMKGGGMINSVKKIQGKQHEQGGEDKMLNGVPVEVEGGEYQFNFKDGSKAVLNKKQMEMYKKGVPMNQIIATMPKNNVIAQTGLYVDGNINKMKKLDYLPTDTFKDKNFAIDFLEGWQKSSKYNEMLTNSLFGNNNMINEMNSKRQLSLKKTDSNFNNNQSLGEFKRDFSNGNSTVELSPNLRYYDENTRKNVFTHEYSHAQDFGGINIPNEDRFKINEYYRTNKRDNKIQSQNPYFNFYLANPTEVRSRLNSIRALGKAQNIYDPYNEKINMDQLNNINYGIDELSPFMQLKNIFTEDQILDMLNTISYKDADNNLQQITSNQSNKSIFKYGGYVKASKGAFIDVPPSDVYEYLTKEKKLSHIHAIGMMGNIMGESGDMYDGGDVYFNESAVQPLVTNPGLGLFQYTEPRRKKAFLNAVPDWKGDPSKGKQGNWKGQIDYVIDQDPMTQPYLSNKFDTVHDASRYFTKYWENPANADKKAEDRLKWADKFNSQFNYSPDPNNPANPPIIQPIYTNEDQPYKKNFFSGGNYPGKSFNYGINKMEPNKTNADYYVHGMDKVLNRLNSEYDVQRLKQVDDLYITDRDPISPPKQETESSFFDKYNTNLTLSTLSNLGFNIGAGIDVYNDMRRNREQKYSEPIAGISTSPMIYRNTEASPYLKRLERGFNTANRFARQSGNPEMVGSNLTNYFNAGENIVEGINQNNLQGQMQTNNMNIQNQARVDATNVGVAQFNKQVRSDEEKRRDAAYQYNKQQLYNTIQSGINLGVQYGQNKLYSDIMRDNYGTMSEQQRMYMIMRAMGINTDDYYKQ